MKKVIIFFILLSLLVIFNKVIISKVILFSLSKWVGNDALVKNFDINYSKKEVIFNSIEIKNSNKFLFKNIFEADKIKIKYDLKSLFTNLIEINHLIFLNPRLYLEFDNQNTEEKIIADNLGIAKKLNPQHIPQKYSPKIIDINFLILSTEFKNPKVFIRTTRDQKIIAISLSNMSFNKIGNKNGFQHYKNIFKIILTDLSFRIPDPKLKNLIKNTYK